MFDFKFDFLTPEQNALFSESVNCFFLHEVDALRQTNRGLNNRLRAAENNAAFLSERNEKLSSQAQCACKEVDQLREDLRAVRLELMDSHRANVTLRESLEKEREHVVKLSAPRPSEVDAHELKSQNEVMSGVIEKLKEELRAANSELREYKDFVKRLIRTMETAPESAKKADPKERPMLKPEAVGDIGGPA